jgi:integrase/recombinase XerD
LLATETNPQFGRFKDYLENIKGLSQNSVSAYLRDLPEFLRFLTEKGIHDLDSASKSDIAAWLLKLKKDGMSAATVNRKLASVRAYYKFMTETGRLSLDPTTGIRSPRIERKEIEYLTIEEVNRLLTVPSDSDIGCRDLAILEMLYATGLRVTELMFANIDDINLRMGFVSCSGAHGKARIIPLGRPARAALEKYIYDIRPHFRRSSNGNGNGNGSHDDGALFLNYYGERITRQALWKIIKNYSEKAGIDKSLTPQVLRNSFAVHMIQNGADLKSIQELMGHEDPIATQVYLSVSKNRIKDVYDSAHPRA